MQVLINYSKSTTGQERLSALAVLSIDSDVASMLNYDTIIKKFGKHESMKFMFL